MWEDVGPEPGAYPADIRRVVNICDGVIATLLERRNTRSNAGVYEPGGGGLLQQPGAQRGLTGEIY